jgi:hypothetical protein
MASNSAVTTEIHEILKCTLRWLLVDDLIISFNHSICQVDISYTVLDIMHNFRGDYVYKD